MGKKPVSVPKKWNSQ